MTAPEDLVNRALDALGVIEPVGDLQQGSPAAKSASRQYGPLLRQLLRAAHWNFARKQVALALVSDGSIGQPVPGGFLYEYLQPSDCLKVRFVPWQPSQFVTFTTYSATAITAGVATVTPAAMSGTVNDAQWIIQAGTVLTIVDGANTESVTVAATASSTFTATFLYDHPNPYMITGTVQSSTAGNAVTLPPVGNVTPFFAGLTPAPYTIATDTLIANFGQAYGASGVQFGFNGAPQTVILTNVRSAQLVYTALILDPDEWDVLFQEAFCAALAARMALAVLEDKKIALAVRAEQIQVAKAMLTEARVANGNETWVTLNRDASWTRARWEGVGLGVGFCREQSWLGAWDTFAFPDGSTI